ncbi:hypothetical protein BGX27_011096 [Mortierella sp. AM989]|nr:hypothetical protein BGX27_011096 [Mortierella sp. AM989]
MRSTSRKIHTKKTGSRSHLSREAKAIRVRIRRLWQDPRQPEVIRSRQSPKNQYILLEESLAGILQIVPLIVENAKATPSSLGHLHSAGSLESEIILTSTPHPVTISTAESSTGSTTALPSSPPLLDASTDTTANPTHAPPKSNGSTPITPAAHNHTRARTTSSNSASTISATRHQIATSILQPHEPNLTDVAQPSIRSPTSTSMLGEPALSTIAANVTSSSSPQKSSSGPQLAESNMMLVSKLLSLSNTFKEAIKTLYEQQNEKVLRFDDYTILDLLMRWEQEADKDVADAENEDTSATSLVTLGATNALERYQITVGKVWEETEVILSSIRKIRDLVELGRIQHHSDFDADDSEEDAVERDEEVKRTLYSTLLFHANGLVTVLGEFLECVSGIQRLVGNIKTQRKSFEENQDDKSQTNRAIGEYGYGAQGTMDFIPNEPRPIKHLDPILMRKLKRSKAPFKLIADKVRRSFTDFAKRSTNSLLTIFPPLGDGSNEGFHWDSYSDNEYDSEEWAPTDMDSSIFGDEEAYTRTLSPPESPGLMIDKPRHRHRLLNSKDSPGLPEQYWPGSVKLGLSDDSQSPINPSSPSTTIATTGPTFGAQSMSMSHSMSSERSADGTNTRFRTGLPDSPPAPKMSMESNEAVSYFPPVSELQMSSPPSASKERRRARPPKPPTALPPMPPSPVHSSSYFKEDEITQDSVSFGKKPSSIRATSYLATKNASPQQVTPPTLDSHFVRRTSIRMANRNRYSVKMPSDEVSDQIVPDIAHCPPSSAFWRRRSYNDALEKSWRALQLESISSGMSETSAQSTPLTAEFDPISRRASVRLSSFEFPIPSELAGSKSNRLSSGSTSSRPMSGKFSNRRHSSPLTLSAEKTLAEALSHRASISSQQCLQPSAQASSNNRSSANMMPTLNEDSVQRQPILRTARSIDKLNFVEVDSLNIPQRPRVYQRDSSFEIAGKNGKGVTRPQARDFSNLGPNDSRSVPELIQGPISAARYNDMKRAWEILNLDAKRLNQYSDMQAYAKPNNVQNNSWAYSHPNAHQSASCPRAILIREKGIDVLVLEKIDGRLQVVAGMLESLIERLADQNEQDCEYVSCFLLSHPFFIDSEDLLERLIARFNIQPHQGEILFFNQWQKVFQCKVLCVINRWIQIQYEDFELNQELLKTLKKFLEVDVRKCGFMIEADCIEMNISIRSRSPKKNCSVIMEQGRFCLQRSRTRQISISKYQSRAHNIQSPTFPGMTSMLEPTSSSESMIEYGPSPELSSGSPILALTALELARYLTLADMKAFRCITVFELMSGWWKRRRAAESKNVDDGHDTELEDDGAIEAFTRRANMLRYWVAHEIVSLASTKHRKQLIKKFIEVAKICRDFSNLHTSMFIVSALIWLPVRRLQATWKMVSSSDMETFRQLEKLIDPSGNMRYYRQIINEASAPVIPFLPILLKDITFILDGNPTMITSKSDVDQTPPVSNGATTAAAPTGSNIEESSPSLLPTPQEQSGTLDASKSSLEKGLLVNFEKFRQLTQYVENAVDMAKSLDYWFEPQLLRQARVFRPTSSIHGSHSNDADSVHGSALSGRGGNSNISPLYSSSGPLDHVSEIVEHRLVKASGLYGTHQKVVEVEFSAKPKNTSLWKGVVNVGGMVSSGLGSGGSNASVQGSSLSETVLRAVQGEEDYLMGLSLMCEPGR